MLKSVVFFAKWCYNGKYGGKLGVRAWFIWVAALTQKEVKIMKISHKIILLTSVLCLYPLMSDAKIRKINEYKQNEFTNAKIEGRDAIIADSNCSDATYAKNHPQECSSVFCKQSGYDTTSGPASDVDKRCFTNPNGTKISNVMCYKYKNGNETDSAYPFDQATCVGDNGTLGVLSGDHKTLYDCANGTATTHEYYKECNCPSDFVEVTPVSGAEKNFAFEAMKLPDKTCVREDSIQCKDSKYALLKSKRSEYAIYSPSKKSFVVLSNAPITLEDRSVVITSNELEIKPRYTFDGIFKFDSKNTYVCFNKTNVKVVSELMNTEMYSTERNDATYGAYAAVCLDLNKAIILEGACEFDVGAGRYPAFYHIYSCQDKWSIFTGTHYTPCEQTGSNFTAYNSKDKKIVTAMCHQECSCTSSNDKYEGGNLYGIANDTAFSLGTGCLISCNSGAGYVEVYKGAEDGCSFCPSDTSATIPGNASGFSNGDTKYTYSWKKIVKGTGALVCGTPVGCNVSAGYIPTTGCLEDSWCSWFNK